MIRRDRERRGAGGGEERRGGRGGRERGLEKAHREQDAGEGRDWG